MAQGGAQLVLPHPPGLVEQQRGKGAVVDIDIPPHLIPAVLAHDIDVLPGVRVGERFLQQQHAAVELLEQLLRELLAHAVQDAAHLVDG